MQSFCGGPLWDTNITWNTENPDFTPCFHQSLLMLIPCIFLILFTPFEIFNIRQSYYRNIPWSIYSHAKFTALLLLIMLSITDLLKTLNHPESLPSIFIVSPILRIVTFILSVVLNVYNKRYGIQSSGVQFMFAFLLLICTSLQYISQSNTLLEMTWKDHQHNFSARYMPLTIILFTLLCFSDKPPLQSKYPKTNNASPEIGASFLSKLTLSWLWDFHILGYSKQLKHTDVYDVSPVNTIREVNGSFEKCWKKSARGSIVPALIQAFGPAYLFTTFYRFIFEIANFGLPFFIKELISYTENGGYLWQGIALAFGILVIAINQLILNSKVYMTSFEVGNGIRVALMGAIYKKVLRLSNSSKQKATVGEIINFISSDANQFTEFIMTLHKLWSAPFAVAMSIYFLWKFLGVSAFAGLSVMIALGPINTFISKRISKHYKKLASLADERIKFMNEILNGIKVLKMYAWEPSFESLAQTVRNREINVLRKNVVTWACSFFLFSIAPFLVALVTFTTFVMLSDKNVLDAKTAFVSISLFNLLRDPIRNFPFVIMLVQRIRVTIERLNTFLNAEELNPDNVSQNKSDYSLIINNGTFSWGDKKPVISDISVKVAKGSLVACVGPVGSGKTSILSAFLGEMDKIKGTVNIDGSIAYVSQQAWIQNATLKENILFGQPYDEMIYNKVIEACALQPDIDMLPAGSETEIGERGINLSGGQKQRVSLARAVYSRADIYLLDDTLSAVDAHVGKHIFDQIIGKNGMLADKTRFLITHGIPYLFEMDAIYVLRNGIISEARTYEDLLKQDDIFSVFLVEYLQTFKSYNAENMEVLDSKNKPVIPDKSRNEKSEKQLLLRGANKIIKDEVLEKNPVVGFSIFLRYLQNMGKYVVIATVIVYGLNHTFSVLSNFWLAIWADDNISSEHTDRNKYLIIYGMLGIGQAITIFCGTLIIHSGALQASKSLHDKFLRKILTLPMSFFDTTPLGRILNRYSRDISTIDLSLPESVQTLISEMFHLVSILFVIGYSIPPFITFILPFCATCYFIQRKYAATSGQIKRLEAAQRSPILSYLGETITGRSTIKAFQHEDRFYDEIQNRIDNSQKVTYMFRVSNRWLAFLLETICAVILFFTALLAVLMRGSISPAAVGLTLSYAVQTTYMISSLIRRSSNIESRLTSVERIEQYINEKSEAPWLLGDIDSSWPQNGNIEFQNLKIKYREGLDLVLRGISFSVTSGEKIGIVGRTGAGKSSLTLALFRILEASGGRIIIDGIDIAKLGLHSLRSKLTIIPQDPLLFAGTLRMNIDPFQHYSNEDIWRVLKLSHLDTYVMGLELGLNHRIAEGGENVSVGQRQLICLARALLRKTKILILDEATAAIDIETDELIQKTIRLEFAGSTILIVAHRLNTITDCDKVLVMDRGEIAEFDDPKVLLNNKNGIFYGMAKKDGLV